ncbi:MAG: hypothetical protein C3F16_06745 [Betaproteobacteria bacterium]|nr:MAG: hypothetical protein C3F16_06745 [Betaproteobacteria bacterium]
MAEAKTRPTKASVAAFLAAVPDEQRRKDGQAVAKLLREVTGEKPVLWGSNIVGFGTYVYRYADGREGEWPIVGFSPRKSELVVYVMPGFERYADLLARLGKHRTGKSCLYLKKLADVDLAVLKEIVSRSVAAMEKKRVRK